MFYSRKKKHKIYFYMILKFMPSFLLLFKFVFRSIYRLFIESRHFLCYNYHISFPKGEKFMKRALSIFLVILMLLTAAPLSGLADTDWGALFAPKAAAYSVGDHIQFGNYPQSKVKDSSLIEKLNATNTSWKSYNYYSGNGSFGSMVASDYMQYRDATVDGTKYRAVRFSKYRPWLTQDSYIESNNYQENNGYYTNTTYWFKYEPISWRVLDPNEGLVMCEMILDSQPYNNYNVNAFGSLGYGYYGNPELTYWASNYAKSSIRKWLNEDFYDTTFTSAQKNNIQKTHLENKSTNCAEYDAPDTDDKMFLLSYWDMFNTSYGFSSMGRTAQGSDYAKAQGLCVSSYNGNSTWRLRSPDVSYGTSDVAYDGGYVYYNNNVNGADSGIRPACRLNVLKDDISMPDGDNSEIHAEVGDHIQFGNYPQSEVKDSALIEKLNATNTAWKSYGYYSGNVSSDYMQYRDATVDGTKYRAVRFSQYRPSCWTSYSPPASNSFQNDNGYKTNTTYWFKFEPICWRVLDPLTGLVLAETILDSQDYYHFLDDYRTIDGKTVYPSNYAYSSIRQWLNEDFYNTAFTSEQKSNIKTTHLENKSTFGYDYYSADTNDKIFLLSYWDMLNTSYGFNSIWSENDTARMAQGSDYAKAQGLYVLRSSGSSYDDNSLWRLRSPGKHNSASCVTSSSSVYDYGGNVDETYMGIRPACNLSHLKSDISTSGMEGSGNIEYQTGQTGETTIKITPRIKNTAVSGSIMNITDLTGGYNAILSSAKAEANSKTYSLSAFSDFEIEYENGKKGITITADKFNDYKIPAAVAESYIYKTSASAGEWTNYSETIFMCRDKEDGKPYISTVFGKESGCNEAYTNLLDSASSFSLDKDSKYDIIVTAGNLKGNVTYYISQDYKNEHTLSNTTGVFSSQSFSSFDKRKTIYVWAVAGNGKTEELELKTSITDIEDSPAYKAFANNTYSLGGSEGISIRFPDDWILIGGKSIDMSVFKFIPVSFDYAPSDGTLKVCVGTNLASKDFWKKDGAGNSNSKWEFFKKNVESLATKVDDYNHAKMDNEILKTFKESGIFSGKELRDIAADKKFGFNSSVTGYIEFHYDFKTHDFVVKEAAIIFNMSLKASLDGQYAAVVYGISGGFDAAVTGKASRKVLSNADPIEWNIGLNVTPKIKVYAGVGIQKVASADVFGELTLPINWSFNQRSIDIALSGEIGVEVKVFVFETSTMLLSGTLGPKYFYYGNETGAAKIGKKSPLISSYDQETVAIPTFEVSDRSYSETTSGWFGDKQPERNGIRKIKPSTQSASGMEFKNLQTSVYDNSNAQIVTCGNKTMAAWIEDDSSRDEYNRTRLVYSLYDSANDTWSAPKAVYDDGYGDAAPYLATDGINIYVSWQKFCKTFNSSNSRFMSDILSPGEIYLAKYDSQNDRFINAQRLTNDNVYDYSPVVTFSGGSPAVYYCTSSGNNMSEADGNRISKYYNGSSSVVKTGLSTVYNLAASNGEIAYAVDTDGDINTTEDVSVFSGSSSFTKFEKTKENSQMNIAYANLDGERTLFVSDGVNIYYSKGGEIQTVFDEEQEISGQINIVNSSSGLSIYWPSRSEKGNEIYTCSYSDGKWSGATPSTNRENEFSNISVARISTGKIIGIANETDRVYDEETSSYIDGMSNLVAFSANDYTDMTVALVSIDESTMINGEETTVTAIIENNGNIAEDNYDLVLTDDYGTEYTLDVDEPLLSGNKEIYDIPYTVPSDFIGGELRVKIETANDDVDLTDNESSYTMDSPSLMIEAMSVTNDGPLYVVDATVTNQNFTTASNVVINSCFGETEGEAFDSIEIGDITRDTYKSVQFMFTENDIQTDENGMKFVYLIAEDNSGDKAKLPIMVSFDETECGHPSTEEVMKDEATCTQGGVIQTVCTACSEVLSEESTSALDHDWSEWTETVAPTCTESGTESRSCSRCEIAETREITGGSHSPSTAIRENEVASTCSKSGTYDSVVYCSACGVEISRVTKTVAKKAHTYTNKVTKATLTADGKITPTCSVCGAKKTATVIAKASGITISATKFVYNGKVQKPTLTVKDSNGKAFATSNYTATWSNASSKAVGSYTVKVVLKGNYSGTKTLTYTIVPKVVTGVKNAKAEKTAITLSWTSSVGAKYYDVYGSTDGKTFKKVGTASTNSLKVTKVNGTALAAGKTYYFKVRALDSTKKLIGSFSSVLKTGTLTVAPTISKLTSTKSKQATVTWGKVTGAKSYTIYTSTDGKTFKAYKSGVTATSLSITKLTGGKKIYVKILAVNAYGAKSAFSAVKNVKVKK